MRYKTQLLERVWLGSLLRLSHSYAKLRENIVGYFQTGFNRLIAEKKFKESEANDLKMPKRCTLGRTNPNSLLCGNQRRSNPVWLKEVVGGEMFWRCGSIGTSVLDKDRYMLTTNIRSPLDQDSVVYNKNESEMPVLNVLLQMDEILWGRLPYAALAKIDGHCVPVFTAPVLSNAQVRSTTNSKEDLNNLYQRNCKLSFGEEAKK